MLVLGARPGFVRGPLANPGFRTAQEAHIAVNKRAGGLLERNTGLDWVEARKARLVHGLREHHIAVEKKSPRLGRIPADRGDPALTTEEGLCTALSKVLEGVLKGRTRHVIGAQPGCGLGNRIIGRARVADYDCIYLPADRAHETLDNTRLIFYHAQKNNPMV